MFIIIYDRQGLILRADREFCKMVGARSSRVVGANLSKFLAPGLTPDRLNKDRNETIRLCSLRGAQFDAWAHVAECPGTRDDRVMVGERLQARALGLELLPGWKSLNMIEGAVVTEDSDGYITFVNHAFLELLGYTRPEEVVGKHWTEIVPADEVSVVKRQLRTRARGRRSQYETRLLARTGATPNVIVSARPIREHGRYQGTVSTFTDITRQKQTEAEIVTKSAHLAVLNRELKEQQERLARANAELKRLSEAKSDFVAAVSHDLRTPLTTIIEGISLVEDGTLGPANPEQQKYLRMAREDAERLGIFINDILDLAKIEAGKTTPVRTRVSIPDQVARALRSYRSLLSEKDLGLTVEIPDSLPAIFCEADHYYRILTNLLGNAAKFTPAGGRVYIRADARPAGMVTTTVKDTGIGIPAEVQDRIFGRFEQVPRPGGFKQPGSGLGLALAKQLVELNRGTIGFTSRVNKGSRFFFALPVYPEIPVVDFLDKQTKLKFGGQHRKANSAR